MTNDQVRMSNEIPMTQCPIGIWTFIRHSDLDIGHYIDNGVTEMKVILLQTIDRLGKIGEIVTVKEGYARNFLIPNNKAKEATPGNMKILDVLKKKEAAAEKEKVDKASELAGR